MLGLKLNHVDKRSPRYPLKIDTFHDANFVVISGIRGLSLWHRGQHSALQTLCVENHLAIGGYLHKGPVIQNLGVYFIVNCLACGRAAADLEYLNSQQKSG